MYPTLHAAIDAYLNPDYAANFPALVAAELECQDNPSAASLIQVAKCRLAAGLYRTAAEASSDAYMHEATNWQAHHLEGVSLVLMALAKAGHIAGSDPTHVAVPVETLLREADFAFRVARQHEPSNQAVQASIQEMRYLQVNDLQHLIQTI